MNKTDATEIIEALQERIGDLADTTVLIALEQAGNALRGDPVDDAEEAISVLTEMLNDNSIDWQTDDPDAVEMGIAALREIQLPLTLGATLDEAWSILESNSNPVKALTELTNILVMRRIEPLSLHNDWNIVQICRAILNGMGIGVLLWDVDDVLSIAPNLTRAEAWQVINTAVDQHSAEYGMNWETLRTIISEQFGVEHLVYDGHPFNVEDEDGEWHTIIAEDMEQAGEIALARGIDVSCIQEDENEYVEDEAIEAFLAPERESSAQDPALDLLHRYPETVAFINDRAACNGFVEDGIIPMPTTPADWLAWVEDEIEMQYDHVRDLLDNLSDVSALPGTVRFFNELIEVAARMRELGVVSGILPWQDEGPFVIYAISQVTERELVFWNNESGWGDLASTERYSAEEKEQYRLPLGGQWVSLRRMQDACPHEWEPINSQRYSMECVRCGKAESLEPEPVEGPSPSRAPEIHWLRCDWRRPPCGWEGTSLEAGWDEEVEEWTCPKCGGSEKLRELGVVPESVLKYAQMTSAEFYWAQTTWEQPVMQLDPAIVGSDAHRVIVHTALAAGHRLPVQVAAEYHKVVDALKETTGCYLTTEPGWGILLTDSDALVECDIVKGRWNSGEWASDPETEPQTPASFMAWFGNEARLQREWAADETDEHEAEQMRMYAEMLEAIVARLRDAGVTLARLPWETK